VNLRQQHAPEIKEDSVSDDYEVGYRKPPTHTRFKPGQSGNPRGRPRGAKNRSSHIPTVNQERMKDVVIEEAYRMIGIREGDRLVEIPMIQAVLRSVAVNAAKGNQRAQRMFTELLRWVEGEVSAQHDRMLEAVVEYKCSWDRELDRRKALGIDAPEPIPHPDDLVLDMQTEQVEIKGPMTKEEKVHWDAARAQKTATEVLIGRLEALLEEQPDDEELRKLLAEQRKINALQIAVIGPYAARLEEAERTRERERTTKLSGSGSDSRVVVLDSRKK
jgi:hypothetical protein